MDAETQKKAVLKLLEHGPKTTFEFRNLGICHPAARVQELRKSGHRIDTVLCPKEPDHRGFVHGMVAKYSLVQGVQQ